MHLIQSRISIMTIIRNWYMKPLFMKIIGLLLIFNTQSTHEKNIWHGKGKKNIEHVIHMCPFEPSNKFMFHFSIVKRGSHGLRTPRDKIAFTARPKIQSQSQIFRYGRSIFFLPHRPNFSDIFDLCLRPQFVLQLIIQRRGFVVILLKCPLPIQHIQKIKVKVRLVKLVFNLSKSNNKTLLILHQKSHHKLEMWRHKYSVE